MIENDLEILPNDGMPTTYVNNKIPVNNVIVDKSKDVKILFLNSSEPIEIPREPVVRSIIAASCGLITNVINTDEINTIIPMGISITAAKRIGNVVNGLKAIPIAGKKTGAD